jgi:tetratricopeptide (TPR) repeat protein
MKIARVLATLVLLACAGRAWAQDLAAQAAEAYRRGDLRQAAKLYSDAADAETTPDKRAEIRVQAAWTYFAMKNRAKTEETLTQVLRDAPALELVPDFYTPEFLTLFERIKTRLARLAVKARPQAGRPHQPATWRRSASGLPRP